jgi:phosphoglucomutase
MNVSPLAGKAPAESELLDVAKLVTAYYAEVPDPSVPAQRVSFGTSGHRGSAFDCTFNERHVLAITEAICRFRKLRGIDGPLFLGIDTHALSVPARASALEVLAAHGVDVMLAKDDAYTPTPVVSHAIICHNRGYEAGGAAGATPGNAAGRKSGSVSGASAPRSLADGIVITPSHNPPADGGFKYNPPNGGPADTEITRWIGTEANELLEANLAGVQRMPYERALHAPSTHTHDYLDEYVGDLGSVIDMDAIRAAGLHLGVDPLGGAGVHYWGPIAERYGLDLTVVSDVVDETFRFMTLDWDGQIRMDPSSPYAMQRLLALKDRFDIAFACDTDHDRHGIVTRNGGLLPPNHYLSAAIYHVFRHRPEWGSDVGVGKTVVSSSMIDRVCAKLGRRLYEVPVGFKWFVDGLSDGSLGFCGEESAGASLLRRDGTAWSTDKDGIALSLLAAEIAAKAGRDPGEIYADLTSQLGDPVYDRIEATATLEQKERLASLSASDLRVSELAGEKIESVITEAPGNGAPIGGVKVSSATGWFAARPSGTEEIYKIYAESFRGREALGRILDEAQAMVDAALA